MKTNKEAQELIYKKANEYFNRKKQQKRKVVLNSLTMIIIIPAVVLSFSMNIFNLNIDKAPLIENSVGGSSMVSGNTQTPNLESSTIPQRKIVYADEKNFNEHDPIFYRGGGFWLEDEEFINKYSGQDVEFLVLINIGDVKNEIREQFKNIPLKGLDPYTNITWYEFHQISLDSYDLHHNGKYTYEEIMTDIDRMNFYYNILNEELKQMERDFLDKHISELNIKYADELNDKYSDYGLFAYITFEDIENFKTLPFGMTIRCIPINIEDLIEKLKEMYIAL